MANNCRICIHYRACWIHYAIEHQLVYDRMNPTDREKVDNMLKGDCCLFKQVRRYKNRFYMTISIYCDIWNYKLSKTETEH